MATGTIKWYNVAKNFGLISQDAGGEDLSVSTKNFNTTTGLKEGQKVHYELAQGPKGKIAINVGLM